MGTTTNNAFTIGTNVQVSIDQKSLLQLYLVGFAIIATFFIFKSYTK